MFNVRISQSVENVKYIKRIRGKNKDGFHLELETAKFLCRGSEVQYIDQQNFRNSNIKTDVRLMIRDTLILIRYYMMIRLRPATFCSKSR